MDIGPRTQMRTAALRARRLVPFAIVVLLALPATLLGRAPVEFSLVVAGGLAMTFAGVLVVAVPYWRLPGWTKQSVVLAFCTGVALVRHGTGGTAAAVLLVLPVVWLAVYGRWRDVVGAVAVTAAALAIPILTYGEPRYPATEWRLVVVCTTTYLLTGLVVSRLMARVTRGQELLAAVVAARGHLSGHDVPGTVLVAVQRGAEADVASYYEHDGNGRLHLAACTDPHATCVPLVLDEVLPPGAMPSSERWGTTVAEPGHRDFERLRSLAAGGGRHTGVVRSVVVEPVLQEDVLLGVIVAGWAEALRTIEVDIAPMLTVLASDAAAAIERGRLLAEMERLASHDQLTGALNRRAGDEALHRELARVARTGIPSTLAMIDLDRFKAYNDEYGHVAGDQLLVDATAVWQRELRTIDLLIRWGGEEFVLILPNTDVESAAAALDRMRDVTPEGQSFSAGLVAIEGTDPVPLIRAVDAALYRAKANGRGRNILGSIELDIAIA